MLLLVYVANRRAFRRAAEFLRDSDKRKHRCRNPYESSAGKQVSDDLIGFNGPSLCKSRYIEEVVVEFFAVLFVSRCVRQGTYIEEYRLDARTIFLRWKGKIHGDEFDSFEVLTDNELGLLLERTVAYRPFPAS